MRYTTLSILLVLAASSAVGHSSAAEPSPLQPQMTSLAIGHGYQAIPEGTYDLEVSEGIDTSADKNSGLESPNGSSSAGNILLFSGQYIRNPVANTVHVHKQKWSGQYVITEVVTWQVGYDQGATVNIIAGGNGYSYVTVEMRSAVSRGFNIHFEIYGR